jgi:hypothetical protein
MTPFSGLEMGTSSFDWAQLSEFLSEDRRRVQYLKLCLKSRNNE